jgi:phage terminase large subunit
MGARDFTIQQLTDGLDSYRKFEERLTEHNVDEVDGAGPLDFPALLKPLFIPKRYKVMKGGRGGAKSWGVARALLIQGANRKLRICCFREIQKNIKESVHQLLKDQIERMGLQAFYEVLETEIRGANGTLIIFAGLSQLTASSIKSYEGLDIAWVEEAQVVRASSWKLLIPTIRKAGSEIWITMNPELETDPSYVMFVENPPSESFVITINYRDNPWFPEVLERERAHAKRTMKPDEYNNVWLGMTRSAVEGAIYADEIAEAMAAGRVTNVPYDPRMQVHVILDLGWNDKMFTILAQRGVSELRVVRAYQDDHITLTALSAKLKLLPYSWGRLWLPHDGAHGDFKTGKTTHAIMRELGWTTGTVPNIPVETGIKRARLALERTYFDKKAAGALVTALRRYKRNLNPKSEEFGSPLHDDASHGGDCFRYLSLVAERMQNTGGIGAPASNNAAHYPIDPEMGL